MLSIGQSRSTAVRHYITVQSTVGQVVSIFLDIVCTASRAIRREELTWLNPGRTLCGQGEVPPRSLDIQEFTAISYIRKYSSRLEKRFRVGGT